MCNLEYHNLQNTVSSLNYSGSDIMIGSNSARVIMSNLQNGDLC